MIEHERLLSGLQGFEMPFLSLTFKSFKEHFEENTRLHGSIAINSCWFEMDMINNLVVLTDDVMILYTVGLPSGNKEAPIKITLAKAAYTNKEFNTNIKVTLQLKRA